MHVSFLPMKVANLTCTELTTARIGPQHRTSTELPGLHAPIHGTDYRQPANKYGHLICDRDLGTHVRLHRSYGWVRDKVR